MLVQTSTPGLDEKILSYLPAEYFSQVSLAVLDKAAAQTISIESIKDHLVVLLWEGISTQLANFKQNGCTVSFVDVSDKSANNDHVVGDVMREIFALMRSHESLSDIYYRGLKPYFQNIVNSSRVTVMTEVLARLQFDKGDLISPAYMFSWLTPLDNARIFVTLYEKVFNGVVFLNDLTNHTFTFNVDCDTIMSDEAYSLLIKTLKSNPMASKHTVLEITEHALLNIHGGSKKLTERFEYLLSIGVKVAIDDFGSRSSNYDRLEIYSDFYSIIKFDKGLIHINTQKNQPNKSVMHYAKKLNHIIDSMPRNQRTIVLEGIETNFHVSIAHALSQLRSDSNILLQGFFFSRPSEVQQQTTKEAI